MKTIGNCIIIIFGVHAIFNDVHFVRFSSLVEKKNCFLLTNQQLSGFNMEILETKQK